jgi:hypothetical protein
VIVGNAFGAMIASLVAVWVQQFSWVQFIWHGVMEFIMPVIHRVLEFVFPRGAAQGMDSWFEWFGQNQARFNFWVIYLAAICDDLGVPSIKTFGRWLKIKFRSSPSRRG